MTEYFDSDSIQFDPEDLDDIDIGRKDMNASDYAVETITDNVIRILKLTSNKNKHLIVNSLVEKGRQSLVNYQADIAMEIYVKEMDNKYSDLLELLKMYFQAKWEIEYGSSNEWFSSFLKQYQNGENHDLYVRMLTRTAEYGNKYMKNSPILSITLPFLFEAIDDTCLQETNIFNDLWNTITNDGIKSITKYSDYMTENIINEQINNNQSALFQAVHNYYHDRMIPLMEQSNIIYRQNLYDLAVNNVTEHGWVTGIQLIKTKTTSFSYERLVKNIRSYRLKQAQESKVKDVNKEFTSITNNPFTLFSTNRYTTYNDNLKENGYDMSLPYIRTRVYNSNKSDSDSELLENFDDAWSADRPIIRQITREEKRAEKDREFAARLSGITLHPISDELRKQAMLLDDDDDDEETFDISNFYTTTNSYNKTKKEKCTACMELVTKTDPRTPCGHPYCVECLKQLFVSSMQDETLMPPRCCRKEIPIDLAQLTLKETEDFKAKHLEYLTSNRLYCSQLTCSAFIPSELIVNNIGTCPSCEATTCAICKAANHEDLECPKDEDTAAVLTAAREAGWTRCYRCRAMIELTHGCYHMTCRCKAEFCYLCTVPWKNCKCVQWNEARLYEEARFRIARIAHPRIPGVDDRVDLIQRVERMAYQLRDNHDCLHIYGWEYTPGAGECEECDNFLPRYLFRCHGCDLMACNRCRHNRL